MGWLLRLSLYVQTKAFTCAAKIPICQCGRESRIASRHTPLRTFFFFFFYDIAAIHSSPRICSACIHGVHVKKDVGKKYMALLAVLADRKAPPSPVLSSTSNKLHALHPRDFSRVIRVPSVSLNLGGGERGVARGRGEGGNVVGRGL